MNTATKTAAANKKKVDDLTVGLCALVVVSSGLTVATSFWPAQLGNAPQLGVVLLASAIAVFSAIHSLYWWRALDEAAQEAHKWAWWWGGNLGLVVGGAGVVAATLMDVNLLPAFVERSDAALVAAGVLGVFAAQAVGYGAAWCFWWAARR
jgi:hypothetical protein